MAPERVLVPVVSFMLAALVPMRSWAQPEATDRLGAIERRLAALEARPSADPVFEGGRIELSGNADAYFWRGQRNSVAPDGAFAVDNARIFFDGSAGEGASAGRVRLAREAGFSLEWDVLRDQEEKVGVGSAYVWVEGLWDQEFLNLRLGRFGIPFGEEYLRWSEARPDNPLFSFQAAAPYNWNEGAALHGPVTSTLQYVVAVQNGDGAAVNENRGGLQSTIKLSCSAVRDWVFTLSGLDTGRLNGRTSGGGPRSAFEFWGTHAEPVQTKGGVGVIQDGVAVPDDPARSGLGTLRMRAWELDAVWRRAAWGRLWGAAGQAAITTDGSGGFYDRDLAWYVVEGVFELETVRSTWQPFYLAARHSGFGTFSGSRGYFLEVGPFGAGGGLGYNARRVLVDSVGIGARINEHAVAKIEYLILDYVAVRGVSAAAQRGARERDALLLGMSVRF